MIKTYSIKSVEIGAGIPKIIVPVAEDTRERILESAESLKSLPVDVVEWRADFYDDALDTGKTLRVLKELRRVIHDIPLIFTFRTKKEGGEKGITADAYTALNKAVSESGDADLIDVECFNDGYAARENIENAHNAGILVIGSNHDFFATPGKDEIVKRLRGMQDMGADIPKIAVMPTCARDVAELLAATTEMCEKYADRPVITVSMSEKGIVSRISGRTMGSAMTFASAGKGSAPGQIPVEDMARILALLN